MRNNLKWRILVRVMLVLILTIGSVMLNICSSNAASSNEFANANAAISSAYVALQKAELNGGNVSSLVGSLNSALALVQKAQSENSTNPAQATSDLLEATQIANQVSMISVGVGQAGKSSFTLRMSESIGAVIIIIIVTILVYIFGGRIFRLFWLILYRSYKLGAVNE